MSLLQVEGLSVRYGGEPVVEDLDLELGPGQALALVGESGAGKSQAVLGMFGLLGPGGRVTGKVRFGPHALHTLSPGELDRLRGRELGFVFQDPAAALNPYLSVEQQLAEVLRLHAGLDPGALRPRMLRLLAAVRLGEPERLLPRYAHELSGGQCQRVMLALALAVRPRLLVADEPTTALDATVQADILALLRELCAAQGTALLFITHDLAAAAAVCSRLAVMYAGRLVETGPLREVLARPAHPYTAALRRALPAAARPPAPIPGEPPRPGERPAGCVFAPRCPHRFAACARRPPLAPRSAERLAACHLEQLPEEA